MYLISLVLLTLFSIWAYRKLFPPKDQLNFYNAQESIQRMDFKRREINVIESLITDIEICDAKHQKGFDLSWVNEQTGERFNYQIWIHDTSDEVAVNLIRLAQSERSALRLSLQEDINSVAKRSRRTFLVISDIAAESRARSMKKKYFDGKHRVEKDYSMTKKDNE